MIEKMITFLRKLVGGCDSSGLTHAGRKYLNRVRAGASSRVLRSGGQKTINQSLYPSKKMGVNIQYESAAEADFVHLFEFSPKVNEYYSQGPCLKYRYPGGNGKLIWKSTIPDFVVVEADRVVLVDIETEESMRNLVMRFPGRYEFKDGRWTCPPAAKQAAKLGFVYEIRTELETGRNFKSSGRPSC